MKKILVQLKNSNYEIWTGRGSFGQVGKYLSKEPPGKAFILSDVRLKKQAKTLEAALRKLNWEFEIFFVYSSENIKSIDKVYAIYGKLLKANADRKTVMFALGGGVIGDVAGFVAGTYMRGIRWIGIPTTLLAQVDSSIGGKTGINHELGKNLIGVFHQPSQVLCDPLFLKSLPRREIISGLGEMIKYGLIFDRRLYLALKKSWKDILDLNPFITEKAIHSCLKWKAQVVVQDEKDRSGLREVLNFGHTLGHALEAETGYQYFRHGEAVLLGMRAASYLSVLSGHLNETVYEEIEGFLGSLPVPAIPKSVQASHLMRRLKWDKKAVNGTVRFVLLKGIGRTVLDRNVSPANIIESIHKIGVREL
jgi:3-dehydroquinate synthase